MSDWEETARLRVRRIYPSGLHRAAEAAALTHEHAVQYLEQAPAVMAFIAMGGMPRRSPEMAFLTRRFGSAVYRQPRLKDVLAEFGAPLPIRKIAGSACHPSYLPIIYDLRTIPPSTLSQSIPTGGGRQKLWLKSLGVVRDVRRSFPMRPVGNAAGGLWLWAVATLGSEFQRAEPGRVTLIHSQVGDLRDFLVRGDLPFNPRWTWAQALAAQGAWHARLARERTEAATLRRVGFSFDHRFDYGVIPDELEMDGFTFVALRSGEELFQEGLAMRHCVASYIGEVARGRSFIIGIRRGERRVATLQLDKAGVLPFLNVQLKGPCNAMPPPAVERVAAAYVGALNRALRAAAEEPKEARYGRIVASLLPGGAA